MLHATNNTKLEDAISHAMPKTFLNARYTFVLKDGGGPTLCLIIGLSFINPSANFSSSIRLFVGPVVIGLVFTGSVFTGLVFTGLVFTGLVFTGSVFTESAFAVSVLVLV
jgi:hypothetical protein